MTLVALVATLSLMMVGLYVAAPSWTYVIRREREEQLLYQGFMIVKAIRAYQAQPGGVPNSFEQLMRVGRVLRHCDSLGDPMMKTKDGTLGKWRRVPPDQIPPICMPASQPQPNIPTVPPSDDENLPFIGVISRNTGESYGIYNNKNHYNEWCFAATDLISPAITNFEDFKRIMTDPTLLPPPGPRFTGAGKADPHKGREPPQLGTRPGGGRGGSDVFSEPGF